MSCDKDEVFISMAYNKGHNDAWEGRPPAQSMPCSCLTCEANQRYKAGHMAGVTARYYYDMGFKAGKEC